MIKVMSEEFWRLREEESQNVPSDRAYVSVFGEVWFVKTKSRMISLSIVV